MPTRRQRSLADPSLLSPRDEDDKQLFKAVVETPKGSRNKYAFDPHNRVFELKKILPAGMAFPYDFGLLPLRKVERKPGGTNVLSGLHSAEPSQSAPD